MNNFPDESWMSLRMYPPESCETYEILLPEGEICRAFWTGMKWWRAKAIVEPIAWRQIDEDLFQKAS